MPASNPAQSEALDESVNFDFDGETYTIEPTSHWDLDVLESYEDGKIVSTVRALLGSDQWAKFRSKPRTTQDLNDLFEALQKALGVSGN